MGMLLPAVRSQEFFKLLGHDIRWNILTSLVRSDYTGQELVRLLKQPQNLVSYHVRLLADKHLITERRNSADERSLYYSLNIETLQALYVASGKALHPALATWVMRDREHRERTARHPRRPVRVLFLCTHNSARSQMAEGIIRFQSEGYVAASSAGSEPSALHPLAVRACKALGIDISQQRTKHVNELEAQSFDYIVTVCDRVRECCPTYPGDPERMHWSFADPAEVEGTEEERFRVFEQTGLQLMTRIRSLLLLIEDEQGEWSNGSAE